MAKRLLALLLAAILLLSLAACGEGKTEEPAKTADISDEGEYQGELPFIKEGDEPVTLTIGIQTSGNVTDYKDNAYTKWLEEQTGLNLEFVQFSGTSSEVATQVSLMIASGEKLPDILHPGSGISKVQADEYGLDGYFLDLTPYFEKYSYYQPQTFELYYPDDPSVYRDFLEGAKEPGSGKTFNFPTFEDCPLDTPGCHAWINREWLDKLGLQMPTTLAELHDVLVAFRDKDPNGNGVKDEIPMIGKADGAYIDILRPIINAYIFWNYRFHFNVGENDKLYTAYTENEYRQALCYINDLVKEGLLSTLTWTQTSAELKSLINPAEDADFLCGVVCGHADTHFEVNNRSIFVYDPLPPFKDETGKGGYGPCGAYSRNYSTYITADCEHPDLAFKLLDFMSSPEGSLWARWGEKGVNWDYSDGSVTGNLGGPAKIKLIGDPVFGSQNSQNWHSVWSANSERYWEYESNIGNLEDWDSCRATKLLQNYKYYEAAGHPDKIFTFVNYTQEENERRTDINSELLSYIKDRRAQFCTGVLDPRNDQQWKEYLDGLTALHYDEWLILAQAAYDRLQK